MSKVKHKKVQPLPMQTAEQMLENIFLSCDQTPNSVPLQTLTAYSNYRKERFALQRTVILVILCLFALLPMLFISTKITITPDEQNETQNPIFHVRLSSVLPVRNLTAQIDGNTQPVYESGSGTYTVTPGQNGEMEIAVTLFNMQAAKETVSVSGVDYVKPRLVTTQRVWDSLRLFFEDPDSGINGMNISVTNQNGASLPYQFDSATGRLSIPYSNETLNVLVPDNRGNVLELLLHP